MESVTKTNNNLYIIILICTSVDSCPCRVMHVETVVNR